MRPAARLVTSFASLAAEENNNSLRRLSRALALSGRARRQEKVGRRPDVALTSKGEQDEEEVCLEAGKLLRVFDLNLVDGERKKQAAEEKKKRQREKLASSGAFASQPVGRLAGKLRSPVTFSWRANARHTRETRHAHAKREPSRIPSSRWTT